MCESEQRQAGALSQDVIVTPAMVDAGCYALCDSDLESEPVSQVALRVFLAMVAFMRKS